MNGQLWNASKEGRLEDVRQLVKDGARVNHKNRVGWTPLFCAIWNGHRAVARFLMDSGADVNIQGNDGRTPLDAAVSHGQLEIAHSLVNRGANVHVEGRYGRTPLDTAISHGHAELVRFLVEKGADVNHKHSDGGTPLYIACSRDDIQIVRYLVESAGVDVGIKLSMATHHFTKPAPMYTQRWFAARLITGRISIARLTMAGRPCTLVVGMAIRKWCVTCSLMEQMQASKTKMV
jgi:ankyrin repeat protein